MPFISCMGRVLRDGVAVPNAVVAHVCGVRCPSWKSDDPCQRAITGADGRYVLQFEAGPEGSRHRLSSSDMNGDAGCVSPDMWLAVRAGETATVDFQI
jgi:hypothetical protein